MKDKLGTLLPYSPSESLLDAIQIVVEDSHLFNMIARPKNVHLGRASCFRIY